MRFLFFLWAISSTLLAQHEGTLTQYNVQIGDCFYRSITVKYSVGSFFGEPTVNGAYKVEGDSDCVLPYSTTIWLKITGSGGSVGYIKLSPTVPKVNEGYGYNFTGSPNWSRFICGFQGRQQAECMTEEAAKALYKEGRITSFSVAW